MDFLTKWRNRLFRTWPVAAAALGGLLLLTYVSMTATSRKSEDIFTQLDELNSHHREVAEKLRRLRSDVYLSSIYIRDYLLDADQQEAPGYRKQLTDLRQNQASTVRQLREILPRDAASQIDTLQSRVDEYWDVFEPLFEWSPYQKLMLSGRFLNRDVLPRREAVLDITRDIEQLNNANLATQRAEATRRLDLYRKDIHRRLLRTLAAGFLVALVAVLRLRALEKRSDEQREHAQRSEQEMRLLSQQLVAAQEEERKKLTRELHDHVGQMLTALRMEIGRADRARGSSEPQLAQSISEAKRLLDTILRSVRDLVMGLRPSMLDDFGLTPALEWHVREFRRRFELPVVLNITGDLDNLPDQIRTCVYRIVQEALTNCARHAEAKRVEISLKYANDMLNLTVSDNGAGIRDRAVRGMGLLGIEERVRELDGSFRIGPGETGGTELHVALPVILELEETRIANPVG